MSARTKSFQRDELAENTIRERNDRWEGTNAALRPSVTVEGSTRARFTGAVSALGAVIEETVRRKK